MNRTMFTTERKLNTKSWWTLLWLSALITRTSRSNEVCSELVYLGGDFGTHRGSFLSPGYPSGTYPNKEQCIWIVKVPLNYRVLLHFDDLDVEYCPTKAKNCTCDYVSVADGQLLIDKVLAKVCGSTTPADITSTGRFVRVDLVTDASNSRNFKGFSATFYSVSPDGATPTSFDRADDGMHHKTIPPLTDEPGKGGSSIVMIAIVCSIVGVVIIGLVLVFIYIKKKKQTQANQARGTQMPMSYPVSSASSQRAQQPLPPPPPYSSVVSNVPPPYASTASIG